jgi:acyl dehydratase
VGESLAMGNIILSEKQIVDFAKLCTPPDPHIDKAAAEKTIFKDLIASGPHLLTRILQLECKTRHSS